MSDGANARAVALETPFPLYAHQRPRAVANFLIVPWPAEEIIPAQFEPSASAIAACVCPRVLKSFTDQGAVQRACAAVGVMDDAGNARAALRENDFRSTEVIPGGPPLAIK